MASLAVSLLWPRILSNLKMRTWGWKQSGANKRTTCYFRQSQCVNVSEGNWLTCRKGSLTPATSCSGEYPEMTRPFMIWTRSGTVWGTHSTHTLWHTCMQTWIPKPKCEFTSSAVPFWSAPAFRGSAHTAQTWAPQRRVKHLQINKKNVVNTCVCMCQRGLQVHHGRPTNRGFSQRAVNEQQGQTAPPGPGLFSQYAQHTEPPGGTPNKH